MKNEKKDVVTKMTDEMETEAFCNRTACKNRWYDKDGYQRCSNNDNMKALFYFRCPYTGMVAANAELPKIERRFGKRNGKR